jgi:hypothetical protein
MSNNIYVPVRLAERGVKIAVPIKNPKNWQQDIQNDPYVPATYSALRNLIGQHFRPGWLTDAEVALEPLEEKGSIIDEHCGENLFARIYAGLANPQLSTAERDSIDAVLAAATPASWEIRETLHFTIRWTESDPNPAHNFDPALIDEAADLLELAWDSFNSTFGRPPFSSLGTARIQVDFQDLPDDLEGQAEPPEGPIVFDAPRWQASPALRAPLSAHELFHKLQYAFEFRRTWALGATNVEWFSEGTARWAEVFVHQRLTASKWLLDWMLDPNLGFFGMSSYALPFWIFFDAKLHSADSSPLFSLLSSCQAEKDARRGLDAALLGLGQDLRDFFARFAAEIRLGGWRRTPTGQVLFPQILGPEGHPLEPQPTQQVVTLNKVGVFPPVTTVVGDFASCYHLLTYMPAVNGKLLRLQALSAVERTYQVISLLSGSKVAGNSTVSGDFAHQQTIQLSTADALLLVISGRGARADVEISAQVS